MIPGMRTAYRLTLPTGEFQVADRSKEAADLHNLTYEILTGEQVNKRFPAYRLPPDYKVMHQDPRAVPRASLQL